MSTKGLVWAWGLMILVAVAVGGTGTQAKSIETKAGGTKSVKSKPSDMDRAVASFIYDGKKNTITQRDVFYERMLNPRMTMASTDKTQRQKLAFELTKLAAYRSLLYLDGLKRGLDRSTTVSVPLEEQMNGFMQRRLKAKVMAEAPPPTPQAIEHYYQAHKSEYTEKEVFQFQFIFSYCDNPADKVRLEQSRKRIDEAKALVDKKMDFAAVALRYSNSPSGNTGQVVAFEPGKVNPVIEECIRKLADGAVSGVLQLPNGFTVIRRVRYQKAGQKPLLAVRHEIRAILAAQAGEENWNKFYQGQLKALNPTVNRTLLLKETIPNDAPVFRFGTRVVTYGQVRPRLESVAATNSPLKLEERNKQLDALFQELLVSHIAGERGLGKDNDAEKMRRETLRELIFGVEIARLSKEMQATIKVTPAEIERYYNENKKYFLSERETRLQVIRLLPPGAAAKPGQLEMQQKADLFQRAEAVRRKLAAGEDFAALMKQVNGTWDGNWAFQPYGPRGHEVDLAVEKLKAGEISVPVEYGQGFYIIKLAEAKAPKQLPLTEVREKINAALLGRGAFQQVESLRDKRLEQCRFKVDQKALAQIDLSH